jgi:hypothetical protein
VAPPSSPTGESRLTGSRVASRSIRIFSTGTFIRAAICSGVGSSPPSWTMSRSVFDSLLCVSTMCTGMRMVRA